MKKILIAIIVPFIIFGCATKSVKYSEVQKSLREKEITQDEYPEVTAFLIGYESFISKVEKSDNDVGFLIDDTWIYFQEGRMLTKESSQNQNMYHPILYDYTLGEMTHLPDYEDITVRSHDFLDQLFGTTEIELRKQCDWVPFLDHKAYMNHFCEAALINVEKEILNAAKSDEEVQAFIDNLETIYSFQQRKIRGNGNTSYHSYGLALDLVPTSYGRKHANWIWSTAFIDEWHLIPLEDRWSPPQIVIDAFENNGFVWGGKWSHFDNIHFEYVPEIILLAKNK